jgi:hypothetical protein
MPTFKEVLNFLEGSDNRLVSTSKRSTAPFLEVAGLRGSFATVRLFRPYFELPGVFH